MTKAVFPMYFFPHRGQFVDSNDNLFPQNKHVITRLPLLRGCLKTLFSRSGGSSAGRC
jgi:hypothetical protein